MKAEKATDLQRRVESIDRKIDDARRERARVADLPVPKAESERRIVEHVDELAGKWRAEVSAFTFTDFEPPELVGKAINLGRLPIALTSVDIALCALFGEQVKQRLIADLAAVYADGDGISGAERRATIDAIDKRILGLEIEREKLVEQAEVEGQFIPRRADQSAASILATAE